MKMKSVKSHQQIVKMKKNYHTNDFISHQATNQKVKKVNLTSGFLLLLLLCIIFIACTDEDVKSEEQESTAVDPVEKIQDLSASDATTEAPLGQQVSLEKFHLPDFLDEKSVEHILAIKKVFEQFLCEGIRESVKNKNCYLTHAQGFSYDFLHNVPYTLNFPYDGKFEFAQMEEQAASLDFLTKNCGFQIQATGEMVNYYCMKSTGKWMDYLNHIGSTSSLIQNVRNSYAQAKTITQSIKQELVLQASNDLNFASEDHQIFYMMIHLLINEERIASEKINQSK